MILKLWILLAFQEADPVRLEAHKSSCMCVAFSPDSHRIASGGSDMTVRLWDVGTWRQVATFYGHKSLVTSVAFMPDGKRLISVDDGGALRVWDLASDKSILELQIGAPLFSLSPDGKRLAAAEKNVALHIWDIESGKKVRTIKRAGGVISFVAWTVNGERLVSACWGGDILIHEIESGDVMCCAHVDEWVSHAVMGPDGNILVTSGSDPETGSGALRFWDGSTLKPIRIHRQRVGAFVLSSDSRRIAEYGWDVQIRDGETGKVLQECQVGGRSLGVAYSRDRQWLASATEEGPVCVWRVSEGLAAPAASVKEMGAKEALAHALRLSRRDEFKIRRLKEIVEAFPLDRATIIRARFELASLLNQSVYRERRRDREGALQQYQEILKLEPTLEDSMRARWRLVDLQQESGRFEDVISECKKIAELSTEEQDHRPTANWRIAQTYLILKKYSLALDFLRIVREETPRRSWCGNGSAQIQWEQAYLEGRCLEGLNRPDGARELYWKSLDHIGLYGHSDIPLAIVDLYVSRNEREKLKEEIARRKPEDVRIIAEYLHLLERTEKGAVEELYAMVGPQSDRSRDGESNWKALKAAQALAKLGEPAVKFIESRLRQAEETGALYCATFFTDRRILEALFEMCPEEGRYQKSLNYYAYQSTFNRMRDVAAPFLDEKIRAGDEKARALREDIEPTR